MHPDEIARIVHLDHLIREAPVGGAVGAPHLVVEATRLDHVVERGPQVRAAEAKVEGMVELRVEEDGHATVCGQRSRERGAVLLGDGEAGAADPLDARVGLQFNLSQAYERLGRLLEATSALELYVNGTTPDDERLADARARLAAIRERIARTAIVLDGGPEGAVLLVDGEDRGRLPRRDPLQVSPGSHEIRVRSAGYYDFTAGIAVPAGQSVNVNVAMTQTSRGPSLGPIVTMAVGGVVLVAGLAVGGVALDQAGRAPDRTGPAASDARTLALVSDILWPVGAAAVAGGLVWLVLDLTTESPGESTAALEVYPLFAPGLLGLSGSGHF